MTHHFEHNHGLYLSVQPISDEISMEALESKLTAALPSCPENQAYLSAITASAAPSRVKCQRLSALICFASLMKEFCPSILSNLRLYRDKSGRPYAQATAMSPQAMDFNLSHTEGLVACALWLGEGRVGVDVETVMASERAQKLSARFFSPHEQAYLASLPREKAAIEATRLWTSKEALSKQDGRGYPLGFDSLCVPEGLTLYHAMIQSSHTADPYCILSLCAPENTLPPCVEKASLSLHLQKSL